jgi:hypothetical protein
MSILNIRQKIFVGLCLAFVIGTQGLFLFWAFWPYQPLVIKSLEIVGTPKPGGEFTYQMEYEKKDALPGIIVKQFVDGFVVALPPISTNLPVGKRTSIHSVYLPKIPPGRYEFVWSCTYQVNPIREVTVTAKTKCFILE